MAQSVVITDLIEGKHLSDSSVSNTTFIQVDWSKTELLLSPGGITSRDVFSALCLFVCLDLKQTNKQKKCIHVDTTKEILLININALDLYRF